MKINIQKTVKCLTVLLAVMAFTLSALSPTAHAAVNSDLVLPLGDYVSGWTYDGDTGLKTVNFDFSRIDAQRSYWWQDNTLLGFSTAPASGVTFGAGWTEAVWRYYPLGANIAYGQPMSAGYAGYAFDVHGITGGGDVHFHSSWTMDITYAGAVLNWRAIGGYYAYDARGAFMHRTFDSQEYTLTSGGRFTVNFDFTANNMSGGGVRYIIPYFEFDVYTNSGEPAASMLTLAWGNANFGLSLDIDAVAENSALQNAIKDKLGDIEDELGDINDKLDDTNQQLGDVNDKLDDTNDQLGDLNDKTDEIISGGAAGDELQDATGPINDAVDDFDKVWDDYEDASDDIPAPPSSLPSPENDDTLNDAISNAQGVFDWEASGLTYMYAPMGLSLSLAILFYVIFGKR